MSTFEDKLRRARERAAEAIATTAAGPQLPEHLLDQHDAAVREVRGRLDDLFGALLHDHEHDDGGPGELEIAARMIVAVEECELCRHLQLVPLQPAYANLAARRVNCGPCAAADNRTPVETIDRCHFCWADDVVDSEAVLLSRARLTAYGLACLDCAAVLNRPPEDVR